MVAIIYKDFEHIITTSLSNLSSLLLWEFNLTDIERIWAITRSLVSPMPDMVIDKSQLHLIKYCV